MKPQIEELELDVSTTDNGSTVSLMALTDKGELWCQENLPVDCPTMGSWVWVVEPRYVANILDGMRRDGLVVR